MSNEEKRAIEIAINNKMTYCEKKSDGSIYEVDSYNECYNSALKAMKYKERKMIEKAVKWLQVHFEAYSVLFTTEQFIEDFKKAMKGGKK